ncbi:hypothetical protein O1M63_12390 [Streptomyces mirabilis]|nr:hypothetical protein [Streptomyces mirabilis]
MTSDNGDENTPRREAMTGRGDVDPSSTGTPRTPGRPAPAPRRPGRPRPGEAPGGGEVPGGTGSCETANPSRSTADGTRTMPADDRDTRAGQGDDMRAGQQKAMRAMQPDSARAGQQESARAGQGGPTSAGQRGTGPQGEGDGALLSHDECDKYALRMQHAVGGFVDGPRASVEEADHVLEELTTEFTDAMTRRRRNLRTTWQAAGESDTADTEKLRLALRDYREVTERLLHL